MEPTIQEVKDLWNSFAGRYTQVLEKPSLQAALSLARMTGVHSAKNILEIGSGSGELSLALLQSLPAGIKYTSVDISEEMIKKAKAKKEALKHKLNNEIEHEFIEANGEDLSFIPDESMDVVLSPLCLHLTSDPTKILKEALRVLKKGGKLGVSVLGDPKKCTVFTIFFDPLEEVMGSFGNRSIFYLGSREKLIKLAQDNGFKVDFCWTETIPIEFQQKEKLIEFSVKNAENLDPQMAQVVEKMGKDFDEKLKNFIPLQTEDVLLVGSKPL